MSLRTLFLCLIVMFGIAACSNTENQDETAAPDNAAATAIAEDAEETDDAVEEQNDEFEKGKDKHHQDQKDN